MRIKNAGELKKLSKDEYQIVCFFCGEADNLHMFPHRKDGKVVGFIYSCSEVPENHEFRFDEKQ